MRARSVSRPRSSHPRRAIAMEEVIEYYKPLSRPNTRPKPVGFYKNKVVIFFRISIGLFMNGLVLEVHNGIIDLKYLKKFFSVFLPLGRRAFRNFPVRRAFRSNPIRKNRFISRKLNFETKPGVSKEELDRQLDEYMKQGRHPRVQV